MKKIAVALAAVVFTLNIYAQTEFEGKVHYKVTMGMPFLENMIKTLGDEQRKGRTNDEMIAEFRHTMDSMLDMKQEYLYKNGAFVSNVEMGVGGERKTLVELFDKKSGNLYSFGKGEDEAKFFSASEQEEGAPDKLVLIDSIENVLGIPCKKLTLKGETYNYTAWYNTDTLYVNPAKYKGFKYQSYERVVGIMKSIPLKFAIESPMVTVEAVAVKIEPVALPDSAFALPSFKKKTKTKPENPFLGLSGGDDKGKKGK